MFSNLVSLQDGFVENVGEGGNISQFLTVSFTQISKLHIIIFMLCCSRRAF